VARRITFVLAAALPLALVLIAPALPALAAAGPALLIVDDDQVQCPDAAWRTISAAVAAAPAGAVVRVCPGTYPEAVSITRRLQLQGPGGTPTGATCRLGAGAPDPRVQAVVTAGVRLDADAVEVDGLVVYGASTGITTTDQHSGYRISHSLVQGRGRDAIEPDETDGIELESDGRIPTRADHNCIRANTHGLVSEHGQLHRARIDHNDTYRNGEALSVAGGFSHTEVRFDHNTLTDDAFGIGVQRSSGTQIDANSITSTVADASSGIGVGGGNAGLLIEGNVVSAGRVGIRFDREIFWGAPDEPTTGAVVRNNRISDTGEQGLLAARPDKGAGTLVSFLVENNVISRATFPGISLQAHNDGNTLRRNKTDLNSVGINLPGAVGTTVVQNSMHDNRSFDARDLLPDQNTWIGNDCETDSPTGLLCASTSAPR
jgi:parallel beta-helix repeat protein